MFISAGFTRSTRPCFLRRPLVRRTSPSLPLTRGSHPILHLSEIKLQLSSAD